MNTSGSKNIEYTVPQINYASIVEEKKATQFSKWHTVKDWKEQGRSEGQGRTGLHQLTSRAFKAEPTSSAPVRGKRGEAILVNSLHSLFLRKVFNQQRIRILVNKTVWKKGKKHLRDLQTQSPQYRNKSEMDSRIHLIISEDTRNFPDFNSPKQNKLERI